MDTQLQSLMKVSHPKVVDVFPTASTAQSLERLTQPDTLPEILQEGIDKVAAQIKRGRLWN
jgi:hypothetical protein